MKYLFLAITKVLIFGDFPKYSLAFFVPETMLLNQMLKLSINQSNKIQLL